MKNIILSVDKTLEESPRQNYVTFKLGKGNVISLWPKDGWIEVVLNAKIGTITDNNGLIYDITKKMVHRGLRRNGQEKTYYEE